MAKFKQEPHRIEIATPLGDDALLVKSFQGREEFSRLFTYHVDLLSDKKWIDPKSIVGKSVTVTLKYPDGDKRHFNGIVSRFAYTGTGDRFSGYRAELVPAAWMLTRTSDCRIFQDKEIPAIIQQVFDDLGFTDYSLSLNRSYPQREYCVQYRETAFNFVSRLMEQYGMFYFFEHSDGKHTMVVADTTSAYSDCQESKLTFRRNVGGKGDLISGWEHQFEYRPGKWRTPTTTSRSRRQVCWPRRKPWWTWRTTSNTKSSTSPANTRRNPMVTLPSRFAWKKTRCPTTS